MFDGGEIVLLNPATNTDSVEYMLNGERFVMRPGQSRRFMRDRDWIMSSLRHFYEQELIDDVLYVAKSGKEATVYCCTANPATGLELLPG